MTLLFEKLFELLAAWINYLLPWAVLGDDECGLIRRIGKYHRNMKHGLNWKWPVLEVAMQVTSARESAVLREQTLTTKDGAQVTLRAVITYWIVDPKKYILECDSGQSVVNDVGCGVIADVIPELTADEILLGERVTEVLFRKVRARAKKWGVDVDYFGLVDRVKTRTYRFITVTNSDRSGVSQ